MKKAFLLFALSLAACNSGGGSSPPPPPPPPPPVGAPPVTSMLQLPPGSGWTQQYGGGVVLKTTGDGFSFAIPANGPSTTQVGTNHVNYIVKSSASLSAAKQITMTFSVVQSVNAKYNWVFEPSNTCPTNAYVTPYFQQRGDNGQQDTYRFWSNAYRATIKPGSQTLVVPLDPAKWGSVFGHVANTLLAGWQAALANPMAIGMTFGGGCFDGHGLSVSAGSSTFTLESFTVQ